MMGPLVWMAIGAIVFSFARVVIETFRVTRPRPVEKATKVPNAKELKRARLELTKRLTNRTAER